MLAASKYRAISTLLKRLPVKSSRSWLRSVYPGSANRHASCSSIERQQLVVDVSVLCRLDARTGIQRVVRALLVQLIANPPQGYEVRTAYASKYRGYRYVRATVDATGELSLSKTEEYVALESGDLFFGLDLSAHLLPRHEHQLVQWKKQGVRIEVVVYDLLPLQRPEWFRGITSRNFKRWLRTIMRCADGYICISQAVKTDFIKWISHEYGIDEREVNVSVMPLGADIEASAPSNGIRPDELETIAKLASFPYALMVGTLEPRKGHKHIIDAFETLWGDNNDTRLVIVGKPGWKTEKLQKRIMQHPDLGEKLIWMTGVSDELLNKLYERCHGVIVASEGEGFGLPLLEALHNNKPVLARNLPVFYEVAKDEVHYFDNSEPQQLAICIDNWLKAPLYSKGPVAGRTTWQSCAQVLNTILEKR